jgi:hypothetical protein
MGNRKYIFKFVVYSRSSLRKCLLGRGAAPPLEQASSEIGGAGNEVDSAEQH